MSKDPFFKRACIEHFVHNFRETNNPFTFAKKRMFEVQELFRAIDDHGKPKERQESDRTREVQIELDRLNRID